MLAINYTLTPRQEAAVNAACLRANVGLTPQQYLNRAALDLLKSYVEQMGQNLRAAAIAKVEAADLDKLPAIEAAIDTAAG